jgi:lipopolysaccharide transport system ATP-binding protein
MVMRLAFSVAIHADPKAFVVDEALSVGDAYFQQKCMRKIKEFKTNGGSILFVSHDMNAIKVLCDQAILLDKGHVVEQDHPEKIINSYNFLIAKRLNGEEIKYLKNNITSGYGNHKVIIENIKLLDENNTTSKMFISGRPLKIMIRLSAKETIENITIGIAIRDKFGQDIYGTNSFLLKKKIRIQEGQSQTIGYVFDELNIGPGKYTLSVAIHTDDTHVNECFHWIDKCAAFDIVNSGDSIFLGLVRLKPELRITNEVENDHD